MQPIIECGLCGPLVCAGATPNREAAALPAIRHFQVEGVVSHDLLRRERTWPAAATR
jgi:hypothetical protein